MLCIFKKFLSEESDCSADVIEIGNTSSSSLEDIDFFMDIT